MMTVFSRLNLKKASFIHIHCSSYVYRCFNFHFTDCDDDWDDVVTALEKLKAEWKVVGRKLHIKSAKLKELESNFPKNCGTCLSDVVQEWLVGNYNVKRFGEPSWRQLAMAMSQLNMEVFRCVAETHSQH